MAITQVASYTPTDRRPQAFSLSSPAALEINNQTTMRLVVLLGYGLQDTLYPGDHKLYTGLNNLAVAPTWVMLSPDDVPDSSMLSGFLTVTSYGASDPLPAQGSYSPGTFAVPARTLQDRERAVRGLGALTFRDFGAWGDGFTDDTAAVNAALAVASTILGSVDMGSGTFLVSSPLTISGNMSLLGLGVRISRIRAAASFSGAQIFNVTAFYCRLADFTIDYANTTYSSNPAADAIAATSAEDLRINNVQMFYVNGYALNTTACADVMTHEVHVTGCAAGIHLLSNAGANYVGQAFISNTTMENTSGDGLFIEDFNDVMLANWQGSIHVKGHVSSVFGSNVDIGGYSGPGVLVETGANGTPAEVRLTTGVVQSCAPNISVTGGELHCSNLRIKGASVDNVDVSGVTQASFTRCNFSTANQSGNATAYDLNITAASGVVTVQGCRFESGIGAPTAGKVTTPVNDSNAIGRFKNNHFAGSGQTSSTVFTGKPFIAVQNDGYNPVGSFSNGADPGSAVDWPTQPYPVTAYIHGGTMTAIKVGGQSTGISASNTTFRLPPNTALNVTYSVAPTIVWFGE